MKRFKKAKKWTLDERLLKTLKISVYERYIMFDKDMSDIIFQNHIEGFDFSENDEGIIFLPGYNFKISKNIVVFRGYILISIKLLFLFHLIMNYLKVKKLKIDEINVESLFFIHLSTNFYKYLLKNTLLSIDFTKKFAKIRISGNSYLSTTKLNSN